MNWVPLFECIGDILNEELESELCAITKERGTLPDNCQLHDQPKRNLQCEDRQNNCSRFVESPNFLAHNEIRGRLGIAGLTK
jgi:hypothetical protein